MEIHFVFFFLKILKKSLLRYKSSTRKVKIAMCGKYNGLHDAYKSIIEAFVHSGMENNVKVEVKWIDTEKLEKIKNKSNAFNDVDGILIPGGFGDRGIEGKIFSSQFAREKKIPFLGICLGLQCAIIDFARNVCSLKNANSTEFIKKVKYPVIDIMKSQIKIL